MMSLMFQQAYSGSGDARLEARRPRRRPQEGVIGLVLGCGIMEVSGG